MVFGIEPKPRESSTLFMPIPAEVVGRDEMMLVFALSSDHPLGKYGSAASASRNIRALGWKTLEQRVWNGMKHSKFCLGIVF